MREKNLLHKDIKSVASGFLSTFSGIKSEIDRLIKSNSMDFDDLLMKTNELLNNHPEVLAKYQEKFKYILVDEYQDTNNSQYLIVKSLSDRYQNICVVGDDAHQRRIVAPLRRGFLRAVAFLSRDSSS